MENKKTGKSFELARFEVRQRRFELPRPLQALPPQSSASTSFATAATFEGTAKVYFLRQNSKKAIMNIFYLRRMMRKVVPLPISELLTNMEP